MLNRLLCLRPQLLLVFHPAPCTLQFCLGRQLLYLSVTRRLMQLCLHSHQLTQVSHRCYWIRPFRCIRQQLKRLNLNLLAVIRFGESKRLLCITGRHKQI